MVKRAACLPAKSAKLPIKRHLAQPLRRSNMLNLVPLYGVPGITDRRIIEKGEFKVVRYFFGLKLFILYIESLLCQNQIG